MHYGENESDIVQSWVPSPALPLQASLIRRQRCPEVG